MPYTWPDHGSEHREPRCRRPQQSSDRCDHPQAPSSYTSQPSHCNNQSEQLRCCHQQVCAKYAQTLEGKLRDAKNALQDTLDKLEDSKKESQGNKEKWEESQRKFEDSQKESQCNKEKWEESQRKFEDGEKELQNIQKRLKCSHKLLQGARGTLHASEEQLEDSRKKVQEVLETLQGSQEHIQASQEQLEGYKRTVGDLKLLLFQTYAKAKQYNEAEEIYYDILDRHTEAIPFEMVLEMKYSYAEQLHEQGDLKKAAKAKEIAEDVWKTRKMLDSISETPGAMSEKTRKSHRQICSIYTSLHEFDAAEHAQRSVYEGPSKDAWTLENGDALCSTLKELKKYEAAARLQLSVFEERRRLNNHGPWDEYTIQSALSRIDLLECASEDLSNTLSEHTGHEREKEHIRDRKKVLENDTFVMLQHVWKIATPSEARPQILEVGHKLGSRLVDEREYADAEIILNAVWEARTALFSEANQSTMSTGRMLADALKLQESPQHYQRAVGLYRRILDRARPMFGEDDDWVISVGVALAETLFLDRQYAGPDGAEAICRWVLEQKEKKLGHTDPQLYDARYLLGKAVHAQGCERYPELVPILQEVYERWNGNLPKPSSTVECGRMLVKAYEEYEGLAALDPIRALFNGRTPVLEKDMLYLESGHLLGKLLINQRNWEGAREVLHSLWDYQADLLEEKRIRLSCGQLYCQSLLRSDRYSLAKKVLRSVELAQHAQPDIFGEGSTEGEQFAESLGRVSREVNAASRKQRRPGLRQRR